MPATSKKQQAFMAICEHSPEKAHSECPTPKVAAEFSHKPPGGYNQAMKKSTKGSPAFTEAEIAQGYRRL